MNTFAGMRVIVQGPSTVRRSWRERLLSWPWRPWITEKVVKSPIGPRDCIRFGDTLVMGPEAWSVLKGHTVDQGGLDFGPPTTP